MDLTAAQIDVEIRSAQRLQHCMSDSHARRFGHARYARSHGPERGAQRGVIQRAKMCLSVHETSCVKDGKNRHPSVERSLLEGAEKSPAGFDSRIGRAAHAGGDGHDRPSPTRVEFKCFEPSGRIARNVYRPHISHNWHSLKLD